MSHGGTAKVFEKVGDDEWHKVGSGIEFSDTGVAEWAHDWVTLEQTRPLHVPPRVVAEERRAQAEKPSYDYSKPASNESRSAHKAYSDYMRRDPLLGPPNPPNPASNRPFG